MPSFSNQTYDQIEVGASLTVSRTVTRTDLEALSFVSGDIDELQESTAGGPGPGAEPVAAEAFFSYLLNRRLPGPGTRIIAQQLEFQHRICIGDTLTATIRAIEKIAAGRLIVFDCRCTNQAEEVVAAGTIRVEAPDQRIEHTRFATPEVIFRRSDLLARLIGSCDNLPPVSCAVIHPCDRQSLTGAIEAARHLLIRPVLVGPRHKIQAAAEKSRIDLADFPLEDVEHSHAAAERGVELARSGKVESLMKGSLHTDELMGAVVATGTGLRTDRRVSHVFVMDVPSYDRLLLISDAAINIAPDLRQKADIVQNAIDLAHVLGIAMPKVAILSAIETVNPDIPSTIDAAALCKMAERRQLTGGLLDGPLAFDNAVSRQAARTKQIKSQVAGQADILIVPDLEAGNMVAKQLQYFAGADAAGIVMGARVPIALTSRSDAVRTRLASAAVLCRVAHARHTSPTPAD